MAKTIGFSVADRDEERLNRLVRKFGGGNRSAFLREAMRQLEVVDRAGRLQQLQRIGAAHSADRGVTPDEVNAIVKKVLSRQRP